MTLTPGASCYLPAKYEYSFAKATDTVSTLLEKDPCAIPDKRIKRELKRRKKQLVFSGADVVVQLQCGEQLRMIRADILDRDLFDANPGTPEHTSWTMSLLRRLDSAAGPNVMDRPVFPVGDSETSPPPDLSHTTVQLLANGDFDELFAGAPDRPSVILKQSQIKLAPPSVKITRIEPIAPESPGEPKYPPLAKAARITGSVEFRARVQADGTVDSVEIVSGHPMLIPAATDAIKKLKFPKTDLQPEVMGSIEFNMKCFPDYHY